MGFKNTVAMLLEKGAKVDTADKVSLVRSTWHVTANSNVQDLRSGSSVQGLHPCSVAAIVHIMLHATALMCLSSEVL
jgi:hypothetical protein